MITKELIDFCLEGKKIKQRGLIEKDFILHFILLRLSENEEFFKRYAFKGGTCLIKCHLGYFRFSEDLDFTFLLQEKFIKKTNSQIRSLVSKELDFLINLLAEISKEGGMDFKTDKKDKDYFEFGDGNRFTTIKIWYDSIETGMKSFIKIQINFIEDIQFKIKKFKAVNLIAGRVDTFLLPAGSEWALKVPIIFCYDLREILCEKVRAILTRRGVKSRDFIDIFMIEKKEGIKSEEFEKEIIKKIKSVLDNAKYLNNLEDKKKNIPKYEENDEQRLMLTSLDRDFYTDFLGRMDILLRRLLLKL